MYYGYHQTVKRIWNNNEPNTFDIRMEWSTPYGSIVLLVNHAIHYSVLVFSRLSPRLVSVQT